MRPTRGVAILTVCACATLAALGWRASSRRPARPVERDAGSELATDAGAPRKNAIFGAIPGPDASHAGSYTEDVVEVGAPRARGGRAAQPSRADTLVAWPESRAVRESNTANVAAEPPTVPVKLAFRALWYLGVDPEAERTWRRAINDPNMPPGVRSDLIVDMIDEGYTDNNHPTKADLPVILARLEIIERHAPYAMDAVNAQAFEEAYQHLLDLYVRLGGDPRNTR